MLLPSPEGDEHQLTHLANGDIHVSEARPFYRPPGNPVLVGSDTFGRYQSGIPTHRYGGPAACLCSPNLQVGRYLQLQHRICSNVKVRLKAQLKVKHALGTRPTGPLLRESTGCTTHMFTLTSGVEPTATSNSCFRGRAYRPSPALGSNPA